MDFSNLNTASKSEFIRAWAVEKAIESAAELPVTDEELINTSNAIEQFVLKGTNV